MKNQPDDAALAAFLARGGNITKLSPDASNNVSDKDWMRIVRSASPICVSQIERDALQAEHDAEREREIYAETYYASGSRTKAWNDVDHYRRNRKGR